MASFASFIASLVARMVDRQELEALLFFVKSKYPWLEAKLNDHDNIVKVRQTPILLHKAFAFNPRSDLHFRMPRRGDPLPPWSVYANAMGWQDQPEVVSRQWVK